MQAGDMSEQQEARGAITMTYSTLQALLISSTMMALLSIDRKELSSCTRSKGLKRGASSILEMMSCKEDDISLHGTSGREVVS